MDYEEFLKNKLKTKVNSGFILNENKLNPAMFDFQKFIVLKALKAGRYAIFADCGLGKTLMQLEWANRVNKYTRKPVLILAPLAVSGQTIKEGEKFGIAVRKYDGGKDGIQITNYEQLENIDCSLFGGVVLDESSILKNYEGATKKLIIDSFANTPYKLACTATPSPNDPMEMGNHSEFLGIMSRNQMLAMYFTHDSSETAKWRIKGHAQDVFYRFVGSWAMMLNSPADIGFNGSGFELPALNIIENNVITGDRDNGKLFNDIAISATNFNSELRQTKEQRLSKVIEIVNSKPNENFIVWIKHNDEGEVLKKAIADAKEVKGSDTQEYKESTLLGFANNEFRVLITKTKIASFGMNYQNCRNQIFASLDFSFEGLYQAIRRSYRFGQKNEVNIHLITTDTMQNVMQSILEKQNKFETLKNKMSTLLNKNYANN